MQWQLTTGLFALSLCMATFASPKIDNAQTTLQEGQQCKPGSRFKIDCNWCRCSSTGIAGCTLRGCMENYKSPDGEQCEDGAVWRRGCNVCNCANGNAVCTRRACPEGFFRDPGQPECEGKSSWKKDCNWCNCVDGKSVCTRRACPPTPASVSPADPQDVPLTDSYPACVGGSHWRVGCNWCQCVNGVAACTRTSCVDQTTTHEKEPQCTNGSRWRHECNQCACVEGKSVCTKRLCRPPASRPTTLTIRSFENADICQQPPLQEGLAQCTGFFKKWTYRTGKGKCEAIVYGGCGGSKNLFDDQEACEAACGTGASGSTKEDLLAAECTEGSVWRQDCSTCRCRNGLPLCTRKPCLPGFPHNPDQPECVGGSSWKKGCNWCHCVKGQGVCAQEKCISDIGDLVGRRQ
ncbi:uncharacterized protein LOC143031863 isoform X2 [Oratosquilla oratoria]|uniref:uncharacterized protein LOC143031863 isoform X2 n=1 Tax=Oratosquilla oratoria TaxID=337810 RepID=UPI003F760143